MHNAETTALDDARPKLLVVEDERGLRRAMSRYLDRNGYCVRTADSLAEAHAHLERESFDLLVLDVGLPDGDGLSLLERDRAHRTLVISATFQRCDLAERGIEHFLEKPFDLVDAVRLLDGMASRSAPNPVPVPVPVAALGAEVSS